MAHRQEASNARPAPRLYLFTPPIDDADAVAEALGAAVAAADIAAVLLRLTPADERSLINRVKRLAPLVQNSGAALILDGTLLENAAGLVARAGADGAHMAGLSDFEPAAAILKPDRIAGIGGLRSRHDAMTAAERGADYVMFGEPDAAATRPPFAAVRERVAWWSGIVEIPCVGYAADLDETHALAEAGAEFVAVGDFVWSEGAVPAARVAEAARRLGAAELV